MVAETNESQTKETTMKSFELGKKDYAAVDMFGKVSLLAIADYWVTRDKNPEYWQGIISAHRES